jgi:hypothetical protein
MVRIRNSHILAALLAIFVVCGTASGVELDTNHDGKIDDILLPSTITRDSELSTGLAGKQDYSVVLDVYAGINPSANVQSLLAAANYAAMRSLLTLVPGTNVQAYDVDLQTAAGADAASVSTYFGKNAGGTVGFFALPSMSLPAWMPSTGPTADNQIIQASGVGESAWVSVVDGLINDAGAGADDLLSASEINTRIATSAATRQPADADLTKDAVVFVIDGGGSAITTGVKADLEVPWNATITSSTLVCDQSGSIVLDLWRDTYANYPATVADTITASAKPTLSAATKAQDATLTGWTTALTSGDILRINVESAATVTRCTLSLQVAK